MTKEIIYALDFDGVICDSAVETGIAGWKAGRTIWPAMPEQCPDTIVKQFCTVRPVLETGYESILVIHLLFEHIPTHTILDNFETLKTQQLKDARLSEDELKKLFGETRDHWIQTEPADWIKNNPLFPGVKKKLSTLLHQTTCYIVTTKQERFVKQILAAHQIHFPEQNIFGLERKQHKDAILRQLQQQHPHSIIHFIEDRLPPLLDVKQDPQLPEVQLFFASWGYNTDQDKARAIANKITVIDLNDFLSEF